MEAAIGSSGLVNVVALCGSLRQASYHRGLIRAGSFNLLELWCLFTLTVGSTSNGDDGGFYREVKLPFEESSLFSVQGSCHGLILLQLIDFERLLPVIVVNPITLEFMNVPECPNTRYCTYGLGYDSSKEDYKIISLSCVKDFSGRLLEIYSLKTKTWRRFGKFLYGTKEISYIDLSGTYYGVFVNGRFHWMDKIVNSHCYVIDTFSLASEKFEEVPLPSGVVFNKNTPVRITSLGGCLAVMKGLGTCHMDIWLMKEYGVRDSWTKITIICPEEIWEVVCILSDNEIVIKYGVH